MNTIAELDDSTLDDRLDAQRDIIRQSINEIASDIQVKMLDVGLTFPSTSPFGILEARS